MGGIPTKHIRYDNLTSAVTAVVFGQGRQRQENDRWVLFRSHYGFDPFYCQPGIAGAHEKGRVEGEVGWFRRNRLSPMPVTESLDELNDRIRAWEAQDDRRRINDRIRTVGQDFAAEQPFLAPLPAEEFDPGLVLNPRVDRSSMITVRMVKYSVPARFIGRRLRVSFRASEVVVFDGPAVAARHQRIVAKGHHRDPARGSDRLHPLDQTGCHAKPHPDRARVAEIVTTALAPASETSSVMNRCAAGTKGACPTSFCHSRTARTPSRHKLSAR
ncbi:MAG: hypothetical protein NVS2B15_09900 [Pseudarthrobacter sp.]